MSTNALEAIQPSNWSREQRRWMQAMLQPGPTPPWSSWQGGVRQAEAAGAVYINNVRANVISALSLSYPAVRQALGPQRFARLVMEGLHRTPPSCGDLSGYGGWLPRLVSEHLKRDPTVSGCPMPNQRSDADDLVWLARLEWALDQGRSLDSEPAWTWADAAQDMLAPDWVSAHTRMRQPWQAWSLSRRRMTMLSRLAPHLQAEWLQPLTEEPHRSTPDDASSDESTPALLQQGIRLLPIQTEDLGWLQALNAGASIESATQQALGRHPTWRPDDIIHLCLSHGLLRPLRLPSPDIDPPT
jgi:Putative DNA-binding domain